MSRDSLVDHIVWDWNGTIFGDSRALIDATIDAFAACGMPPITRVDYQRHHMQPITEFYNRLAGRTLSDEEQGRLDHCFHEAYTRHRETVALTADSVEALSLWERTGRRQSLLSMHPHEKLMPLVNRAGIARFFTRIDGSVGRDVARKAPHLQRHLQYQEIRPDRVLVIGDSIDDALAAQECGAHCLLYHPGEDALHAREHFEDVGVPIMESLRAAVEHLLDGATDLRGRLSRVDEPMVGVVMPEPGAVTG